MTTFFRCLVLITSVIWTSIGHAAMTQLMHTLVPEAQLVGEGKMTYFFWDVYDAKLFAPQGKWQDSPPYALSLIYLRDFDGADIAERSVKEMQKQGFNDKSKLQEWEQTMTSIFPDVKEGTELVGIFTESGETHFYKNNEEIGVVKDADFSRQFFAIWLSEKTSEPKLRAKLVGGVKE